LQTPERFTSLATILREPTDMPSDQTIASDEQTAAHEPQPEPTEEHAACDDVRLFRARVAEALESAVDGLYRDLAADVLARELMLQSADVSAICTALLARYAREVPVAIRVHPRECEALSGFDVAVLADQCLRPGDVMLDVANGSLDATLAVRLDQVLCKRQT